MTSAWLRQALLKDRITVASQSDACFRAISIAVGVSVALAVLLLVAMASGAAVLGGLALILLVLSLVALAGLVLFTRRLLQDSVMVPLTELAATARQVAGGNLAAVGPPHGALEWQQLSSAIGGLAASLAEERSSRAAEVTAGQNQEMSLRRLLRVFQHVGEPLAVAEVAGRLAEGMRAVGGFQRATVWMLDDENEGRVVPLSHLGDGAAPLPMPRGEGHVGRSMNTAQTIPIRAGEQDSGFVIPLPPQGLNVIGAVELRGGAGPPDPEKLDAIEMLASYATNSIRAARDHEAVERSNETDALTKIANRRKLDVDLKHEVARSIRYGRPLSLIMVDVDHFKAINDTFGHQQGDEVLKAVAAVIGRRSRETDSAYRYGGEEFAVLLRETPCEAAVEIAERLRNRIREGLATLGLSREITASLGVSAVSERIRAAEQLVEAADGALYAAKEGGRNRVVVSDRI